MPRTPKTTRVFAENELAAVYIVVWSRASWKRAQKSRRYYTQRGSAERCFSKLSSDPDVTVEVFKVVGTLSPVAWTEAPVVERPPKTAEQIRREFSDRRIKLAEMLSPDLDFEYQIRALIDTYPEWRDEANFAGESWREWRLK
jgi:hypothetical protein